MPLSAARLQHVLPPQSLPYIHQHRRRAASTEDAPASGPRHAPLQNLARAVLLLQAGKHSDAADPHAERRHRRRRTHARRWNRPSVGCVSRARGRPRAMQAKNRSSARAGPLQATGPRLTPATRGQADYLPKARR